jgi:formate dehydrogenase
MIAYVIQKEVVPSDWLDKHTVGLEAVRRVFSEIDVDSFSRFAGVSPDDVKAAALAIAQSKRSAYYEDLGVQMAPHSTLVSYLNLLLLAITGHFGREGTMGPLKSLVGNFFSIDGIGSVNDDGYETVEKKSPVAESRIIGGLVPCNVIPTEILTDHPNRYRALWVESGNPCHSLANSSEWRRAMRALDLSVVIDVAMTETARSADYVLPASSQYEKWESTFFNFEYPDNHHHLRQPLLDPLGGTLSEPEMHARFIEAMNPFDLSEIEPLKQAAKQGLDAFTKAVFEGMAVNPHWGAFAPYILYRTLGPELPDDAAAAAQYWALAHQFAARHSESVRRAGFVGEGAALGNDLFRGILAARSGVVFSVSNIEESFSELGFSDHKIRLAVGEMLDEVVTLDDMRDLVPRDPNFPLLLAAGERRAYTANTIIRDPRWIKKAEVAALAIHSEDAAEVGVLDGGIVLLHTKSGSVRVTVYFEDRMKRGTISLPNGLGLIYPDDTGTEIEHGIAPNELTSSDLKDKFLGTPLHKHVPARLEAV